VNLTRVTCQKQPHKHIVPRNKAIM